MFPAKRVAASLALALWLGLSLSSSVARAEIESPLVREGLAAFAAADYPRAVTLLDQARKESLTREEKLATYQTLGRAHAALDQPDRARAAFERLLRLDPGFQLDRSVAPKVRAVFEDAKARAATSGSLKSALPPVEPALDPARPRAGRPITVRVSYPGGVAQKMAVYYRPQGATSWSRLTADGPDRSAGRFEATLPAIGLSGPSLEYHVALLDEAGAAVAAAGSLGQPLSIAIQAAPRPVYKKGWFWGVVGGVAAAGALATALAIALPHPSTAPVTVIPQ